eukprot:scaffold62003_cov36-Cyclotella_meneghiniana.AAC.1
MAVISTSPPTADGTSTPNVNAYSPVIAASTSADFAPPSPTPPDTNMIRPFWPAASHQIQPPPQLPSIPQPAMIMEERLNLFQPPHNNLSPPQPAIVSEKGLHVFQLAVPTPQPQIGHFSLACYTTTNWNRKRHGGREPTQPKKSKFMGGGPKYNNQLGKITEKQQST